MGVNLNFGVNGYVAVKDMNDRELYRQPVQSVEEAYEWLDANQSSIEGWGILKSLIVPVRVDNWKDLSKDLFLPTFVNHALRINDLANIVWASIIAIALDVITLPVRLIVLPFRLCTATHSASPLPVEALIKSSPYLEEIKKSGVVRLVGRVEDASVIEKLDLGLPDITDQRIKDLPFKAITRSLYFVCNTYLKVRPKVPEKGYIWNRSQLYMRHYPSGEWNPQAQKVGSGYTMPLD